MIFEVSNSRETMKDEMRDYFCLEYNNLENNSNRLEDIFAPRINSSVSGISVNNN